MHVDIIICVLVGVLIVYFPDILELIEKICTKTKH